MKSKVPTFFILQSPCILDNVPRTQFPCPPVLPMLLTTMYHATSQRNNESENPNITQTCWLTTIITSSSPDAAVSPPTVESQLLATIFTN